MNRLADPLKHALRRAALTVARLRWRLPSGIAVEVRDHSDWILYNDLFVLGEYDVAIDRALADFAERRPARPFLAVDLGANVGFFAARLADAFARRGDLRDGAAARLEILAIEGHPRTFGELSRRVAASPLLAASCRPVHGLVGARGGEGRISDPGFSAMSAVGTRGARVEYLDLEALVGGREIDLLKCDIEGGELAFLETYGAALLPHVRAAVFELHRDRVDVARCRAIVDAAGFLESIALRDEPTFEVRAWFRGA